METKNVEHSVPSRMTLARAGLISVITALTLFSQAVNRVSGIITDQSGAVITGATVVSLVCDLSGSTNT
jgi:hypothetical protein